MKSNRPQRIIMLDYGKEIKMKKIVQVTCCFCGKDLKENERHNAEDYGLHKDTFGEECCPRCDKMITRVNRNLSMYLKRGDIQWLDSAIRDLQDIKVTQER